MLFPSAPLRYIVTSRLEKYRTHTESWLKYHHISYGRLYMLDLPDKQTASKKTLIRFQSESLTHTMHIFSLKAR
jgi:uncharacterized HAD superfamily protein